MKRLLVLACVFTIYCLLFTSVSAEITSPYTVDEKSQVLFGDSTEVSGKSGLESYTYNYVSNYLHITFTYTHSQLSFASYPPKLYITALNPTSTSSPTERDRSDVYTLQAQPVPPGHATDWYSYDIQFDATGYNVTVLQGGATSTTSFHKDISGLTTSDYAALVNEFPKQNPVENHSMAFTPLQIYSTPVATTTPTIIVPGIMSTKLFRNASLIWPDFATIALSITDDFLDVLKMNSDGSATDSSVIIGEILKSASTADYWDSLFNKLNSNGFVENTDIFSTPYDWRLDISSSVLKLKEKIDAVKAQRGVTKVNLVAHSMGGLLVKKYLKDYGGSSVDKFIDIGTPHTGSPSALKTLNFGDNLGVSYLFGIFNVNKSRIKEISQNMPAVYELLPSSNYFNDYGYYVWNGADSNDRLSFS